MNKNERKNKKNITKKQMVSATILAVSVTVLICIIVKMLPVIMVSQH
jgi:uncharacterized membrane protein YvbJ